jgi:hypothetical protein
VASSYDAAVELATEPSGRPPRPPAARPVDSDVVGLRDYFAGQALCGLLASPNCPVRFDERLLARMAYAVADTMLTTRQE